MKKEDTGKYIMGVDLAIAGEDYSVLSVMDRKVLKSIKYTRYETYKELNEETPRQKAKKKYP